LTNIEYGDKMSEGKAEKDRAKKARKAQEKAEKTEKGRMKKARKAQEKADRAEKDRVDKAQQVQDKAKAAERSRVFKEFLSSTDKSKGCCEPCNYHVRTDNGEYQPCKMGHEDSGPDKEICVDCSEPRYRPKK
jgi:membrane protein involved in colicin uptake